MPEHLREVVLHTIVAALMVEAVLRLWKAQDPALKLTLRLVVALGPPLGVAALEVIAPFRHAAWFTDRWALLASQRWSAGSVAGVGLDDWWFAGMTAVGLVLLLSDLVPLLLELSEARQPSRSELGACPPEVEARVAMLAALMKVRQPDIRFIESEVPLLLCQGVRRPGLVVSRAALNLLDAEELHAAIAHELAHVARRDLLAGWGLLALRTLLAFNPVVQLVAGAIALDLERRADDDALAAGSKPLALASGLVKTYRASRSTAPTGVVLWRTLRRAREASVEQRCRRAMDLPPKLDRQAVWARAALVAASAGTMLFFVT